MRARYTALDARALYEHKSAGGAVYRGALRTEVRERLPWVSWRHAGRGLFEIDGVEEEVLRRFSREYTLGDRVVARRNHRVLDVDNGTHGTIVDVNEQSGAMLIRTDLGELRAVHAGYVADHLEHAYALTAHGAQGATFNWTGVIGQPEEFTREWAYTALSRARPSTTLHVVMERPARERERDEYAPPGPERDLVEGRQALANAMRRTEVEQLAIDQTGTLMSGSEIRASTPGPPPPTSATPPPIA